MANRNVFTADITDGQYQKGSYTTPEGNVRTGIHVFTTLSRSKQRVVPMVSTSQRVELSSMNRYTCPLADNHGPGVTYP